MKPPVWNPDWQSEVVALYHHDMQELWDRHIAPHVWNQYHNQLQIYLSLAAGKEQLNVLDVGCAQATLALLLAERGHRVCAVDIRQHFLDYARSRYTHGEIEFVCGNILELELPHSFDLIFANQIIEHLVYPQALVDRLVAWLRPGGRLVITTPNGAYVKNDLPHFLELGDPCQYEDRQFSADGDGHFFAYLAEEVETLFYVAGLHDVQTRFFETPWISGHMKLRHLHRLMPTSLLRLFDRLVLMMPWVGCVMAHQILVIGRRT